MLPLVLPIMLLGVVGLILAVVLGLVVLLLMMLGVVMRMWRWRGLLLSLLLLLCMQSGRGASIMWALFCLNATAVRGTASLT